MKISELTKEKLIELNSDVAARNGFLLEHPELSRFTFDEEVKIELLRRLTPEPTGDVGELLDETRHAIGYGHLKRAKSYLIRLSISIATMQAENVLFLKGGLECGNELIELQKKYPKLKKSCVVLLKCKPTTFSSVKNASGKEIHLFTCPFCGHKSEYQKGDDEEYICVNPGIGGKQCPTVEVRKLMEELEAVMKTTESNDEEDEYTKARFGERVKEEEG